MPESPAAPVTPAAPAAPPAAPPAGGPPAAPLTPPAPPAEEVRDPAALLSAYNAEKEKRKNAAEEARTHKEAADAAAAQVAALQAKIDGTEAEHAAQVAAQKVKDEALAAANTRILKAEVRAVAAGKLADPADALLYLDLSKIQVGADGEVDTAAVTAAVDKLITDKPYLAAQGKRFQGGGDGGPRTESEKSIDEQIADASKSGNHALAISLKRQKAYADKTP